MVKELGSFIVGVKSYFYNDGSRQKNLLSLNIYADRRIAWFWFIRRTWQAAISLGEWHAHFDPKISYVKTFSLENSEKKKYAGN